MKISLQALKFPEYVSSSQSSIAPRIMLPQSKMAQYINIEDKNIKIDDKCMSENDLEKSFSDSAYQISLKFNRFGEKQSIKKSFFGSSNS